MVDCSRLGRTRQRRARGVRCGVGAAARKSESRGVGQGGRPSGRRDGGRRSCLHNQRGRRVLGQGAGRAVGCAVAAGGGCAPRADCWFPSPKIRSQRGGQGGGIIVDIIFCKAAACMRAAGRAQRPAQRAAREEQATTVGGGNNVHCSQHKGSPPLPDRVLNVGQGEAARDRSLSSQAQQQALARGEWGWRRGDVVVAATLPRQRGAHHGLHIGPISGRHHARATATHGRVSKS